MYVGIDIGGTKTLVALLAANGKTVAEVKFPTSDNYQQFLKDYRSQLASFGEHQYKAGAAGVAGVLNRAEGLVISCGNLSWHHDPLQKDLEEITGCPFVIENDAKAGGLGEAVSVIDDFKRVLFVTIGTGIGLSYTVNGLISQDINDTGGHNIMIEHNGQPQPWESFASGTAIVKQFGKRASDITDPRAWDVIARNLAVGIPSLLEQFPTDVIIIGGGVGAHFDKFGSRLESELLKYQTELIKIPPLRAAQHPEQAVIYGCYQLILQNNAKAA